MQKLWIDPNAIYLPKPMNPRPLDQGFIESLRESMEAQGFLPQYPVKVFEVDGLTSIETDLQYACVSGMHRTSAAQLAKLDDILCEVYEGDDDAFIEMMMTDNFEYDPMQNSELGQIFSKTEKRKACKRLLYIPKFLRMTNSALADAWHTGESNVRRWRKEVTDTFNFTPETSLNGGGGAPTFPEQLSRVGITPERLQELKDIDASREREDADGNTVPVRKPRADASEDEKETFWREIEKDLLHIDVGFDLNAVKAYCAQKWNIEVYGWGIYRKMHIDQLRKLHQMLLEQDADFIAACTAIHAEAEEASKFQETLEKTLKKTVRVFCKLIDADNKWDDKFKSKWKTFEGLVKSQFDIEMFGYSRWDYNDMETAEERRTVIEQHKSVQEAIKKEADWIADFMKKEEVAAAQKRKKVSELWTEKRDAVITAIREYPRDVSFDRIISTAEQKMYKSNGYFNKIFDAESVSGKKHIGTLEDEIMSLGKLARAIMRDDDWVSEIPAAKLLAEPIPDSEEMFSDPEFTLTADDLHSISLDDIFQHVADRVVHIPVENENEVMGDMATLLGKASRGMAGTQLYLLMKYALIATPKRGIDRIVVEKDAAD